MVNDQQVILLFKLDMSEDKLSKRARAAKAGMSERTARRYRQDGTLPSERKRPRTHSTRPDPFKEVWDEVVRCLEHNPGLEVKALFEHLRRQYPGRFKPGQLRTLQRRVKQWRTQEGPPKEVYFDQVYAPGDRAQSDFTCMNKLNVTIGGEPFPHRLYHFVLAHSNWEDGTICQSESFEAFSEGLQRALARLGGVPRLHQTDSMSCAVRNLHREGGDRFTDRYGALLRHYGMEGRHTQPNSPHENGKIERLHHRLKRALHQELVFRGSRDFDSREDYARFVEQVFHQLNSARKEKLEAERAALRPLPARCLAYYRRCQVRVSKGSTIRIQRNSYSVPSQLIGAKVDVRVYAGRIEVWHGQKRMADMPRLHGNGKHRIDYRHVIDTLVRKPGAFAHYRYRAELFPSHRFRMAYDALVRAHTEPLRADKAYLRLLHLAAKESESAVEAALRTLMDRNAALTEAAVRALLERPVDTPTVREPSVDLRAYDRLLHQLPKTP